MSDGFHPDLRRGRWLPRRLVRPSTLPLFRAARWLVERLPSAGEHVSLDGGAAAWVYRPDGDGPHPAVVWLHGGGLVTGFARQDEAQCARLAQQLGAVVAAVEYRLAPAHPYPTPLEDCHAALRWLAAQPDVDAERIAVAGQSAGGGLAAALCQLARDRGGVQPVFQVLVYPMLDDRTATREDIDQTHFRLWDNTSNHRGWSAYLQDVSGEPTAPAVPARCDDLSGLPPAWIGVGTLDLFRDEDLAYAERLQAAGVPCTLEVVPGAYHGFDAVAPDAPVVRTFREQWTTALARALGRDSQVKPVTER